MENWLHLTAGKYAGMDINPHAKGVSCYLEKGRIYIDLSYGWIIRVEPQDEEETINKLVERGTMV